MLRTGVWVLLGSAVWAAPPPAADVVVIGAGIAGLTTALEAARGGAQVAVVDMASVFGGHAVVSEGGLCMVGTPLQAKLGSQDSPDLAYADFLRWGEDANAAWVRMYVDRSRSEIYDWMTGLGVNFDSLMLVAGNSTARFHRNPRRGYGLVEPVYRECLKSGRVRFYWNTRISRLLRQGNRIAGVEGVNDRTAAVFQMSAKAVVIATGGFQSNPRLVRENWPKGLPYPSRILTGSGVNAKGSGLDLARSVGAAIERLDHQWNYPRGLPDPRYPGSDRGLNFMNGVGVWVNAEGRRFVDESASSAAILKAVLHQPANRAWIVFDSVGRQALLVAGTDWADPERVDQLLLNNPKLVHKSDSLDQLARKAGWPVETFLETARSFEAALREGTDTEFGRFNAANPPTARVGRPAIPPLAVAPFYAAELYPVTRKSMGGIAVDLECEVLDGRRQPIPGLYAAGEATGFNGLNGKAGLEGTFIGPSILQGRILGRSLGRLGGGLASAAVAGVAAPPGAVKGGPACTTCHPIAKLIATSRAGYWHFERVHKVVAERGWECATCHAEMAPFQAGRHKIDALRQIDACARCHLGVEP